MSDTARRRGDATRIGWGYPRVVAAAAGAFLVTLGIWAMVDPRTFFDGPATFEPYNRHFLMDIGAFQIGLGAVLLLAVLGPGTDTLAVVLLGVGTGLAFHLLSHALTSDEGGTPETRHPVLRRRHAARAQRRRPPLAGDHDVGGRLERSLPLVRNDQRLTTSRTPTSPPTACARRLLEHRDRTLRQRTSAVVRQLRDPVAALARASPEEQRSVDDELGMDLSYEPDGRPHVTAGARARSERVGGASTTLSTLPILRSRVDLAA